ncbi:histidine phosphatase superfamily [Pyrenochaeta sp. MPI-SDFR-AT-0127]|nr:histidine phosphatase superfamily [Pyrenochaeta sp. MPI-SDFR-AT-0127]
MAPIIYLVRHAESEHNVSKDFSQLDPSLTTLGYTQAAQLVTTFPHPDKVAAIISSPLRRTIQTSLTGFRHVLDKRYFDEASGSGVKDGIALSLDPDLQERSAMPCDTGSDRQSLKQEFLNLDLEQFNENWQVKSGRYAADDESVTLRAARVREKIKQLTLALRDNERKDIVIVTHGVFMKFLSGDENIDLPKAGWKSYAIKNDEEGAAVLIPVDEI